MFGARRGAFFSVAVAVSLCAGGCGKKSAPGSSGARESPPALPKTTLAFPDGSSIAVELALTPQTREYGLMNRTSLPPDYGMLFVFAEEAPIHFWMKNTLVDLDMIFIGRDKRITAVFKDVPRSAPDTPEANLARRGALAQYVLELPAGASARRKLERGQALAFDIPSPLR
ncbi:MAG: DUF192 domain-containing protein [Elusimicrobia bacterium]|nr:DUF192 domain-containing protein [Elusimicrobiota bacterium]